MFPVFEEVLENITEELFLREVMRKYHFPQEQFPALAGVAGEVRECVRTDNESGRAGWKSCPGDDAFCPNNPAPRREAESVRTESGADRINYAAVCITLGSSIDALQERYLTAGNLTEGYMAEALASEMLLRSYPRWNREAERLYGAQVRRYHFLGSEPELPLEGLPELLDKLDVPVTCNAAYCMIPKKSVAFYAELAAAGDGEQIACEGICMGCGNRNCPNRMERSDRQLHADHVFTYGYQRIFGIQ